MHPAQENSLPPVQDVESYRLELYDRLIDRFVPHLNAIHREERSRRYWELIVGPWLLYYIYDAHRRSRSPAPVIGDATVVVPYDYESYLAAFDTGDYGDRVAAIVARGEAPKEVPYRVSRAPDGNATRRKRGLRYALTLATKASPWVAQVGLCSPYFSPTSSVAMAALSGGRILPMFFGSSSARTASVDPGMRTWKGDSTGFFPGDDFEARLHRVILAQLPCVHAEAYARLRADLPRVPGRLRVLYSAVGWQKDESFKLYAANAREEGIRLVGHQHGGLYGAASTKFTLLEARNCDTYLTWGWGDSAHIRRSFGAKLSETRDGVMRTRPRLVPTDVLYATTTGSPQSLDALGCPSGEQWPAYFAWQGRFLRALSHRAVEQLVVRPDPGDGVFPWRQRERLASMGLPFVFSKDRRFRDALARAKLFVTDNNITTLLEAYASDVPTVSFFDPALWPLSAKAEPIFRALELAGAHARTPEKAAAIVDTVHEDPRAWWDSSEVRRARQDLVNTFARTSDHFTKDLTGILLKEASVSRGRM